MELLIEKYPDEKDGWYQYGESLYHFPGGGKQVEALAAFDAARERALRVLEEGA